MIFIEPMLGMCNRIRAIDSVLGINIPRRHSVTVIWLRDPDLNCRFDELFQRSSGVDRVFDFSIATPFGRAMKYFLPRVLQNVTSRAIHQKDMDHLLKDGFNFADLVKLRSLYIRTWDRFHLGQAPLTSFCLVPDLQTRVNACGIDRNRTVGVHIRRTDNQWQKDSPRNSFVLLMEEEIAQRPDTKFFLATDSPEEEAHLRGLFPERITTYKKRSLDRNSPEGIKDAAVDLYCLAGCSKIIGSHRSSFSEAASQIGQCPLLVALKPGLAPSA